MDIVDAGVTMKFRPVTFLQEILTRIFPVTRQLRQLLHYSNWCVLARWVQWDSRV